MKLYRKHVHAATNPSRNRSFFPDCFPLFEYLIGISLIDILFRASFAVIYASIPNPFDFKFKDSKSVLVINL